MTSKDLKSNMDRFIAELIKILRCFFSDLKSNMDRFIEMTVNDAYIIFMHLKSNMDRFIVIYNVNFLKFFHI